MQQNLTKRLDTQVINYFDHPFSRKRETLTQKGFEAVNYVFDGNICYAHTHALPELFNSKDVEKPFILVTEAADQMITADKDNLYLGDAANPRNVTISRSKIPETIVRWFSTAINFKHNDVVECCPIGVYDGYLNGKKPQSVINKIRDMNLEKTITGLMNFNINGRIERKKLHNFADGKTWISIIENDKKDYEDVLLDIAKSKFVFCPISNGIETSRIWESIYLGAIPIIINSDWAKHFLDLPLLLVNDWMDVNTELLNNIWQSFSSGSVVFDYTAIDEKYWLERIKDESDYCTTL